MFYAHVRCSDPSLIRADAIFRHLRLTEHGTALFAPESPDVGILNEDGHLRIVDRLKDMIIRGGEIIYPKEIEDCLYAHSAVIEAAVVGKPNGVLGEVPVAFVATRPGLTVTVDELLAHCAASLARYKVPSEIHIRAELPKNSRGELVKGYLGERLRADQRSGDGQQESGVWKT